MIKVYLNARQKEYPSFLGSGPGMVILLFIVILTGPGCALLGLQSGKSSDPRAEKIIHRTQAFNSQITTSKGTGQLTLTRGFRKEKYKIAWAAQSPNRLRMTLLMSGHPVETIAATGQWVTFVSHTGAHKPHSAVSADPDLNPYINIPLRLSELVSLLLGRVPERTFDTAWILPETPDTVFASQFPHKFRNGQQTKTE
jgi:outer membrane lipoprotein-sorting protein